MTFGRIMDWHVHHLVDDLGWWRRDGHMHWHRDALDFGDCVVVRAVDHLGVTANPSQVAAVALLLTSPSLHEVIHVGVTVEGMRVHHHLVGNHFGWRCRNRHWNGMRDRHVPHMSVVFVVDHDSLRRWCHRWGGTELPVATGTAVLPQEQRLSIHPREDCRQALRLWGVEGVEGPPVVEES